MKLKLTLALLAALVACSDRSAEERELSARDVKDKLVDATEAAGAYAAQTRDEYVRKAKEELAALDARIQAVASRAAAAKEQAKGELALQSDEALAKLRTQREALSQRLAALETSSGEAWRDMRAGLDNALTELKKSAESAAERFR